MNFDLKMDNGSKTIINKLMANGYEGYIVGGCVRDLIMGITPKDFDITTDCTPNEVIEIFKDSFNVIPTGKKYGTVTIIIDKIPYEVTTYRKEDEYKDNRHPEKIEYQNELSFDLARRDFTINAMAYNERDGLIDLYRGVLDIKNKVLRAVGDANIRFNEDALRIIRAYRFTSRYDLTIERKTLSAIYINLHLLKTIANERIVKELKEIFENGYDIFNMPFIEVLIPELSECFECEQNTKYHLYNVGEHIYKSFNEVKPVFVLKLSMLLHDIGKPYVKTTDDNGCDHFYNHSQKSKEIANIVLRRLKIDNKTRKRVLTLVEYHDIKFKCDKFNIKCMLNKLSKEVFDDLMQIRLADEKAKNLKYTKENIDLIEKCIKLKEEIIRNDEVYSIKQLDITGDDIKKEFKVKGEIIGRTLDRLLEVCMADSSLNKKEILLEKAKEFFK